MRLIGLHQRMTQTIAVMRNSVAGGQRGELQTLFAQLPSSPLYPVEELVKERLNLVTQTQLLQTAVETDETIKPGDGVTFGVDRYAVRGVERWPHHDSAFLMLYVEAVR